jgi:hypothetical protein
MKTSTPAIIVIIQKTWVNPMAIIFPDGWKELEVTGAHAREIETLALLANALPDDYRIYHGVHWTGVVARIRERTKLPLPQLALRSHLRTADGVGPSSAHHAV